MVQAKIGAIKKIWTWIKSLWCIGSNFMKILEGQDAIKERLAKIEEAIKSPQYQLAELEKIKATIDLLKENNEQEKKLLERGSREEIEKHKVKIAELTAANKELHTYEGLILQTIDIIKQKNSRIEELNMQIKQLRENAPSALSLALAGRLGQRSIGESLDTLLGSSVSAKINNY